MHINDEINRALDLRKRVQARLEADVYLTKHSEHAPSAEEVAAYVHAVLLARIADNLEQLTCNVPTS